MNNTQKLVVAGLVGAAAGAIAGVLLAPEEGKKTREKLSKSLQGIKSNLSNSVENMRANVEELVETGKRAVNETVESAKANGKVRV